jgi:hypothetical protein
MALGLEGADHSVRASCSTVNLIFPTHPTQGFDCIFIQQALGQTAICTVDESVNRTRVESFWNGWILGV